MMILYKSEKLSDLANDLPRFVQALETLAARLGLALHTLEADHISVRCHQQSTAKRWQEGFMQIGTCFSEKIINGRTIALFSLTEPLAVGPWQIDTLELPWPGKKHYAHEGWEHVEIVLRGEVAQLGRRATALFSDEGLRQSGISFKTSSPAGEGERLPNPVFAVTDGHITIKFHPWSLREIVASEQKPAR